MRKLVFIMCVAAVAVAVVVLPAQATFKGKNGLLAYQQQVGDHIQLFTVRPDGDAAQQVTDFADSDAVWPSWSPDGTKIGFTRVWQKHGETTRLYTMNADGTGLHVFGRKLRGVVAWLPDGKHVLVVRALKFTIVNANGTGARYAGIPGLAESPCFFGPDNSVAILVSRNGSERDRAIFVGRLGGGRGSLKRITPWQGMADKIDCSPDGTRIVFSSPQFGPPASANVFTIRVDGTGLQQLTHNRGGRVNNGADSWSPDGKKIAFVSNRDGEYRIYTMNADGTGVKQLTHDAEAHAAAWGTHP